MKSRTTVICICNYCRGGVPSETRFLPDRCTHENRYTYRISSARASRLRRPISHRRTRHEKTEPFAATQAAHKPQRTRRWPPPHGSTFSSPTTSHRPTASSARRYHYHPPLPPSLCHCRRRRRRRRRHLQHRGMGRSGAGDEGEGGGGWAEGSDCGSEGTASQWG